MTITKAPYPMEGYFYTTLVNGKWIGIFLNGRKDYEDETKECDTYSECCDEIRRYYL